MASLITAEMAGTLPGLFRARIAQTPNDRAYMMFDVAGKTWQDITWTEIGAHAARFRAALTALGLDKGERVALLLPNSIDWVGFDMAALSLGLVVVPLYAHDSAANTAFILNHSGARLAFVDTRERWEAIAALNEPVAAIEKIWVRQKTSRPLSEPLSYLADILPDTAPPLADIAARPDDLATLVYTSGTTGRPKGVMLSHAAILWNAEAVTKFVMPFGNDVFLSFLPLAHAFERTLGYYLPMMAGSTIAYARSIELLRKDLIAVRPTIFLAVPRLYERIYAAIHANGARSRLRRFLINRTAAIGWHRFEWQHERAPRPGFLNRLIAPLLRRYVAQRILEAFGGRIRLAVSGGAPLPNTVARFLIGMGLPLVEGYGLTEAGPVVTGISLKDNFPGSVGRALPGSQLKLSEDDELWVRSPSVMQGYWRDAEATRAALGINGWLRTGDIAEIRDGRVFIGGRLKDIIVLSTGENINPDPIEIAILGIKLAQQVCVVGDGRPFPSAMIVLDRPSWEDLAADLHIDPTAPNVGPAKDAVLESVAEALREFSKPAQVRRVHLVLDPWTIDNGLLTPTLKVKRHAITVKYARDIAALYGGEHNQTE